MCIKMGKQIIQDGWSKSITPSIKFTLLYTWVERGTVRVKCLARENNTMSPPGLKKTQNQTTRSGDERTTWESNTQLFCSSGDNGLFTGLLDTQGY